MSGSNFPELANSSHRPVRPRASAAAGEQGAASKMFEHYARTLWASATPN